MHINAKRIENDEETCRLADPPLISAMDNSRLVGLRAAEMLDAWMRTGKRPAIDRAWIPPLGVATRRSTEVTAVSDPMVARACQLIRAEACDGLTVPALVKASGVSKTLFYARFKKALNRLPNEEILRAKLDRAQSLLRQTNLSATEIAVRCGFQHPEYLTVVFKRSMGITPGAFRGKKSGEFSMRLK